MHAVIVHGLSHWDGFLSWLHLECSLFSDGVKEGMIDKLGSILAQFEYQYQVHLWESKGVPFGTYLYVPEKLPLTKKEFHEREDFAHVLKVGIVIIFSYFSCSMSYIYDSFFMNYRELLKVQDVRVQKPYD